MRCFSHTLAAAEVLAAIEDALALLCEVSSCAGGGTCIPCIMGAHAVRELRPPTGGVSLLCLWHLLGPLCCIYMPYGCRSYLRW